MNKLLPNLLTFILLAVSNFYCSPQPGLELQAQFKKGSVQEVIDLYGNFFIYVPDAVSPASRILVLVHGTPAKDEPAEQTASYYVENWVGFADENDYVLIAPAFNQPDFSSRKGEIEDSLTGYRGLFGREIGADEWVLRIVDTYQEAMGTTNQKFELYGHSAGGQFVARFIVTHPQRVSKAVISAAVSYPQPDPEVSWPYGMGPLITEIIWDDQSAQAIEIFPDQDTWLAATQVPLTVIVGMNDTEPQLQRPGQKGPNRITIGKNWVQDMMSFAQDHNLEGTYTFELIPGKGHSMYGLIPFAQAALEE